MPVLALAMGLGGALRAIGAARLAMASTLIGGLVNAVLDPILIFGLDLGIAGAAWASVGARFAVLLIAAYGVFIKTRMIGRFKASAFGRDILRIGEIAGPAVLTNVATPFGDDAVAGFSIIGRIIPVAFGAIFALSGAVGPVIGQNAGAEKFDRVRRALLDAAILSTGVVVLASAILYALREPIAGAFGASEGATALFSFFTSFVAILFVFTGAQFIANAAFNNLGRPLWSSYVNWGRVTIGTIPLVWLGARWLGPEGVVLGGQAIGGVLFGAGAFYVAWNLCSGAAPAVDQRETRSLLFRVPLSAQTIYRGWTGVFGTDRLEPQQGRDRRNMAD